MAFTIDFWESFPRTDNPGQGERFKRVSRFFPSLWKRENKTNYMDVKLIPIWESFNKWVVDLSWKIDKIRFKDVKISWR